MYFWWVGKVSKCRHRDENYVVKIFFYVIKLSIAQDEYSGQRENELSIFWNMLGFSERYDNGQGLLVYPRDNIIVNSID